MSLYDGIRKRLIRSVCAQPIPLAGKAFVVTGAAPGSLGFEAARTLAAWGGSVVVTTRSEPERAAEAIRRGLSGPDARARIDAHALELSSRESVERFAAWLLETHGSRLDVLMNNAGAHLDLLSRWKEPRLSDDGFETHWRTNYLGTAHLTLRLLPLLERTGRATRDARVVTVVSHLYERGSNADLFGRTRPYDSWKAYGNSKLALMHLSTELERRHSQPSGIRAVSLHPGSVFTNVADHGLAGTGAIEWLRKALAPVEAFILKTPEEGAQTQIHCATHPQLEGGAYYVDCAPKETNRDARDAAVAGRLWAETEAWLAAGCPNAPGRDG